MRRLGILWCLFALPLYCSGCETEAYVVSNPPLLVVGTDLLDFGLIPVDFTASRTVQLANAGQQALDFESLKIESGGEVFILAPSDTTILGGQSMNLSISFTPSQDRVYEGTIKLISNSQDKSETVIALRGQGDLAVLCEDCSSPPESDCADENTLTVYLENGECVEGICRYEPQTLVCPHGCLNGACLPAPDAGHNAVLAVDSGPEIDTRIVDAGHSSNTPQAETPFDAGVDEHTYAGFFTMLRLALTDDGACAALWQDPDRRVACWGQSDTLGQGDTWVEDSNVPKIIPDFTGVNRLVAGAHHVCATKDDNRLWCWGRNDYGELGDGTTETQRSPTPVEVLAWPVKEFALGRNFTCAIVLPDGVQPEVHCWGQGDAGQLGQGSSSNSTTPQKVLGLPEDGELYELKAGDAHACVVYGQEKLYCWGQNQQAECMVANPGNLSTSQHVYADGDYTYLNQIDLGGNHGCLLHEDEQVRCWGSNGYGQVTLAPGYSSSYANPVTPDGLEDESMLDLATGGRHSCAIKTDRTIHCWGHNAHGACGSGAANNLLSQAPRPVVAPPNTDWYRIYTGKNHTCAADADHQVYCWGSNGYGQLGIGTDEANRFVPTPVTW